MEQSNKLGQVGDLNSVCDGRANKRSRRQGGGHLCKRLSVRIQRTKCGLQKQMKIWAEKNEIKRRTKTAPETPIIPSEFPIRAVFCVLKLKFKIKSECTNNKLMFFFSYRPAAVPVIEQYEICIKKLPFKYNQEINIEH